MTTSAYPIHLSTANSCAYPAVDPAGESGLQNNDGIPQLAVDVAHYGEGILKSPAQKVGRKVHEITSLKAIRVLNISTPT